MCVCCTGPEKPFSPVLEGWTSCMHVTVPLPAVDRFRSAFGLLSFPGVGGHSRQDLQLEPLALTAAILLQPPPPSARIAGMSYHMPL